MPEKTTQVMMYGGSLGTILSGLSLNQWGVIVGMVVAVLGLVGNWAINIYFSYLDHKLKRARLAAELAGAIRGGDDGDA